MESLVPSGLVLETTMGLLPDFVLAKLRLFTLIGIMIALIMILSFASPVFLTRSNFINIVVHSSVLAILAIGLTFVILTGGLDLSVGSVVAFAGLLGVLALQATNNVFLGLVVAVLTGVGMGIINGVLIGYLQINAFIATIATLAIYRGATLTITGGHTISVRDETFNLLGQRAVLGIPVIIPVLLILYAIFHFVLRRTVFGRSVYAIGGNADAARVSGIRVQFTTLMVYALSGGLAGLCSIFVVGRLQSLQPWAGRGAEFETIVAVVLGGINIAGGEGDLMESLVGVAIIAIILNAMHILPGIDPFFQSIVKGGSIIVVLAIYERLKKYDVL